MSRRLKNIPRHTRRAKAHTPSLSLNPLVCTCVGARRAQMWETPSEGRARRVKRIRQSFLEVCDRSFANPPTGSGARGRGFEDRASQRFAIGPGYSLPLLKEKEGECPLSHCRPGTRSTKTAANREGFVIRRAERLHHSEPQQQQKGMETNHKNRPFSSLHDFSFWQRLASENPQPNLVTV